MTEPSKLQQVIIDRIAEAYDSALVKDCGFGGVIAVCGWMHSDDTPFQTGGFRDGPWRVVAEDGTEVVLDDTRVEEQQL